MGLRYCFPESAPDATITGNCPPDGASYAARACINQTSCTQQLSGVSTGFGLARTESGATFAAWVEYSSQGSYALIYEQGGEMPLDYCFKSKRAARARPISWWPVSLLRDPP